MTHLKRDWKLLSIPFNKEINDALQQQHQAAQFIALVGKHLVPNEADDSNTNMDFAFNDNLLRGNALPSGFRMILGLTDLRLRILDGKNNVKKNILLIGKTKDAAFVELKQSLSDLGVDVANFTSKLHYEIPAHSLDKGAVFSLKNENSFIENKNYRQNAELALQEIAKQFKQADAVKIWPHHFDTGSFIPVSKNEKGELSQSIGFGWAMPDTMVDEPYYYLSFWSEKPMDNSDTLAALPAGQWKMPNWNGAVLKQSEIMQKKTAEEQFEIVKSYFEQGIDIVFKHLKSV
jgi:hypothetical protein